MLWMLLQTIQLFQHLLDKQKVKKPRQKKAKPVEKPKNDITKHHIKELLDQLDMKAVGKRKPEFVIDKHSNVSIMKHRLNYVLRNADNGDVILPAT